MELPTNDMEQTEIQQSICHSVFLRGYCVKDS